MRKREIFIREREEKKKGGGGKGKKKGENQEENIREIFRESELKRRFSSKKDTEPI